MLHLALYLQRICLIALANMISLSSNIHFERLSTKTAPNMPITALDEISTKKKHITKIKEIATAIPKIITLPTPSTPTRYAFVALTLTAH